MMSIRTDAIVTWSDTRVRKDLRTCANGLSYGSNWSVWKVMNIHRTSPHPIHSSLQCVTSCARGDTICPRPSPPPWRPSASRAAEQKQRSSSFPRPIRSHGHHCTSLTR